MSTIMKFLDSGPSKATDSSLKARVLASEPDNAEGIHNFAPLGMLCASMVARSTLGYLLRNVYLPINLVCISTIAEGHVLKNL